MKTAEQLNEMDRYSTAEGEIVTACSRATSRGLRIRADGTDVQRSDVTGMWYVIKDGRDVSPILAALLGHVTDSDVPYIALGELLNVGVDWLRGVDDGFSSVVGAGSDLYDDGWEFGARLRSGMNQRILKNGNGSAE